MKKGFTLLELLVVIIILGILAALGLARYFRVVEKSRSSEARQVIGVIRESAAAYYADNLDLVGFGNSYAGIGAASEDIPVGCRSSHYFSYNAAMSGGGNVIITATRCTAGGKAPNAGAATTIELVVSSIYNGVDDTWQSDPVYK